MIEVVAGVIKNEEKNYLIALNSSTKNFSGCWEFPGGKVQGNETDEKALKREIKEELGVEITVGAFLVQTVVKVNSKAYHIKAYLCDLSKPEEEKIILTEHTDLKFVSIKDITSYAMSPADSEIRENLILK